MQYCVVKETTKIIEGSDNPREIMLQNALNTGFTETEFEMLTEEEYQARKALEPQPLQPPTTEERLQMAEDTLMYLLMGGM